MAHAEDKSIQETITEGEKTHNESKLMAIHTLQDKHYANGKKCMGWLSITPFKNRTEHRHSWILCTSQQQIYFGEESAQIKYMDINVEGSQRNVAEQNKIELDF